MSDSAFKLMENSTCVTKRMSAFEKNNLPIYMGFIRGNGVNEFSGCVFCFYW